MFETCFRFASRRIHSVSVALLLLLALTACQSQTAAIPVADVPPPTPALPTATSTPRPVQISTVAAPPGLQALNPPREEELAATATAGAQPTATATPLPIDLPPTGPPATATNTATPPPTFTPPSLPQTQPWEHFWLRRPIPDGGTVWTDKVYPYGSDRGGTLRTHHGVEFNVPSGTDVLAAASGRVVHAGPDDTLRLGDAANFYGQVVVIELDSSLNGRPVYTLYGHLSEILVTVGQAVQALDLIGRSGATGVADGPHLHFEVRVGENSYEATRNPLLWLYPFPNRGVVAGRITWSNGVPAQGVPVSLRRIDAVSPYAATTSYADDSVNPDDTWNENFVLDDVTAGYYELTVDTGGEKIKVEFWVYAYQTSLVEIHLN